MTDIATVGSRQPRTSRNDSLSNRRSISVLGGSIHTSERNQMAANIAYRNANDRLQLLCFAIAASTTVLAHDNVRVMASDIRPSSQLDFRCFLLAVLPLADRPAAIGTRFEFHDQMLLASPLSGAWRARPRRVRPAFRNRKYLRTSLPSRPGNGASQDRHVTS